MDDPECSCASDTAGAQRLTARGLSEHQTLQHLLSESVRQRCSDACVCLRCVQGSVTTRWLPVSEATKSSFQDKSSLFKVF